MKMAVWSALGVFAAAVFTVGLFGWIARPFMNQAVRQMLSKVLSGSSRS
ncbi:MULTISPECIES: hypothetical protein [Bradyrhizobium]|uniref:Uncharacterized protein n=1 Tax=Bradyrhizobium brasilense TaxID=1419277 RepID=A0ABY8JD33_9BRAD|nr:MULTISPECIES: hypothetical protein [Bradyrhizobium]MCP3416232.1 hypothetical protein [Bradyrhizobium brasilense]WFU62371.1 hypothetical protein QA636_33485 [Bradyrhizobium brasilense]